MNKELKNILLIGNGPSATKYEVGAIIDAFDGDIVRFNQASVKGFESKVGSRTDIWVFCGNPPHDFRAVDLGASTALMSYPDDFQSRHKNLFELYECEHGGDYSLLKMPWSDYDQVNEEVGHMPSSGVLVANYFLNRGHRVSFYGFDHFSEQRHHYWSGKSLIGKSGHDPLKEREWFLDKVSHSLLSEFRPYEDPVYLVDQYKTLYRTKGADEYCSQAVEMYGPLFAKVFKNLHVKTFVDWGCGESQLSAYLEEKTGAVGFKYDPSIPGINTWDGSKVDLIYTTDVLEHIPIGILGDDLQAFGDKASCFLHAISTRPAIHHLADGQNAHCTVRTPSWWGGYLTSAYPGNRGRSISSLKDFSRKDIYIFLSTP